MTPRETLADFLLARIAEDEERGRSLVMQWHDMGDACQSCGTNGARVLAECDAKRRIVEYESGALTLRDEAGDIEMHTWSNDGHFVSVNGERMTVAEFEAVFTEPAPPSKTLKLFALPYADHPDFQEEWRP